MRTLPGPAARRENFVSCWGLCLKMHWNSRVFSTRCAHTNHWNQRWEVSFRVVCRRQLWHWTAREWQGGSAIITGTLWAWDWLAPAGSLLLQLILAKALSRPRNRCGAGFLQTRHNGESPKSRARDVRSKNHANYVLDCSTLLVWQFDC